MGELSRYTPKVPIGTGEAARRVLSLSRRANLGDYMEAERRGWFVEGDVRDEYEWSFTGFMIQQLCGLAPHEVELIDSDDLPEIAAWLRPFVVFGSRGTGGTAPQTSPQS